MDKQRKIISLKWKFALTLISVLLLLHSVFSFLIYTGTAESYERHREVLRRNHINIAKALVKESFLVLEQISEAMLQIPNLSTIQQAEVSGFANTLEQNWSQWQMSWGLENIALYNHQGKVNHYWGDEMAVDSLRLSAVIKNERPDRDIICPDFCYQNVIIPVLDQSGITGALSVTRSLVDIIIEYWTTTRTDLGILVLDKSLKDKWPYKLSAMSNASRNQTIFATIVERFSFDELFETSQMIKKDDKIFEVIIFPVEKAQQQAPYFLLIEDITTAQNQLQTEFRKLWWYGGLSLILSLGLVLLMLHFSLSRITLLSSVLPLLARHRYDQFRKQLSPASGFLFGYDELDHLNNTATTLADQLELLETEVQTNTRLLTDKSRELASERDFINQLVETAPIILITQNRSGKILSINQTGAKEFGAEQAAIVTRRFDNYLPGNEIEHLNKLERLRNGKLTGLFQIDGMLLTSSGNNRYISWLHSLMKPSAEDTDGAVVLTIGVDVSERKKAEEQTHWLATHDQLTGLSNRRHFHEEFNHLLAISERHGDKVALFYLDLDQFKIINDTSGHQAGDNLLQLVASVLQESVRDTDMLSRIGGDEFTLIITKAKSDGIIALAKKINTALTAIDFHYEAKKYPVSCSIGIAIYPEHGSTSAELLSNADLAMYQAKEAGHGLYHIFTPGKEYQKRLTKRRHWKELIEKAIDENQFILYFQPIQDLSNHSISHYECLVRIQLDDGRIMMPGDFIGIAEELGLIGRIDRLVIKLAIEQHLLFQQQNKKIALAINLSGFSFNDLSIFSDVAELFELPGVDPSQLIFEITETSAVSNFSAAQSLIKMIKSLGCKLALDDFGVGFSSFYYLKHLPVEYIKIDGSFVQQIDKNDEDKIFVKAIADVSQALGKKTIAEFVENEVILNVVKELGVDYAQGYFIGKPERLD